jgi:hypothetical protein
VPIRCEIICGCHVNLFLKNTNSHFGLFWKIHVWQKLTQQMIKKHVILCQKKPVRHIREMSCYHLCTFYILYKKPWSGFLKDNLCLSTRYYTRWMCSPCLKAQLNKRQLPMGSWLNTWGV